MRLVLRVVVVSVFLLSVGPSLDAVEPKKSKPSTVKPDDGKSVSGFTWQSEFEKAWKTAEDKKRPLLLFLSMDGCYYCKKMERDTYANEEIAKELRESFVPVRVKYRQDPQLVRRYKVQVFPTTVIIYPGTKRVEKFPGYVGPSQMKSRLASSLSTDRR
ncbi:MAG TPA: thioredoxin family protein [Planctomycetaceae bacterium]|nr:thioredoxin family protein [Planctomycetaceae bacterium]